MPVKFNPFTGQLQIDEKGSGGGSSYIDGEVATYNDLPLDGTAALNSAWLVREASGIWPVSRKQAGIYIRTATAGSSRDADYTYAGTMPDVFSDAVFTLYDDASTTRTGQFNLGSITAGQNRVLTWPDSNGTIARTEDFAAPPAIGSTTRNAGAFTTLNATNGTLTASAPVLDLSQTWNNAAAAFTGLRFNVTNTASAATSAIADFQVGGTSVCQVTTGGLGLGGSVWLGFSTSFGTAANMGGVWRSGNAVAINANSILGANANALQLQSISAFGWASGVAHSTTSDLRLWRDAADTLAQRRDANPQTFRLYNTTDSGLTNFERGFIGWSSNTLRIGTEKGGTGSARGLELQTDGTTRLTLDTVGTVILQASGALTFSGRTGITSPSAGSIRLLGTDASTFNFLYLGVASSSYPALKRSSAILQVRLGDDSAYTTIDANHRLQGTAPATSGATGTAGDIRYDADYIYICTAANTWKRAAIATW